MAGGPMRTRGQAAADQRAAHERLEDRLSTRIDESIRALEQRRTATDDLIMSTLGNIQADLRRGQLDRAGITNRLAELEIHLGENRDVGAMLRERLDAIEASSAVTPAAAASVVKQTPRAVWTDLSEWQKRVAIVAGVIAALAGLGAAVNGLEKIGRGAFAGVATAWSHIKADPVPPKS